MLDELVLTLSRDEKEHMMEELEAHLSQAHHW